MSEKPKKPWLAQLQPTAGAIEAQNIGDFLRQCRGTPRKLTISGTTAPIASYKLPGMTNPVKLALRHIPVPAGSSFQPKAGIAIEMDPSFLLSQSAATTMTDTGTPTQSAAAHLQEDDVYRFTASLRDRFNIQFEICDVYAENGRPYAVIVPLDPASQAKMDDVYALLAQTRTEISAQKS